MTTLLARGQITIAAIKDGKEGADAVSVLVENAPLVFDTNDDGIVSPDISKQAKVKIMRGNRNVSDECSDVNSRDDMCVNCKCGATQENGYISVSISSNNITKNDVIVDGVSQGKVPATSGYAVAQVAYDGVTYFAQVPFSVNVAKFTGVVAFNNKSYKIQFEELSKNAATKDELKDATSKFEQTAREISLSVSEKTIGRRNLLIGSAFQRDDNNRVISNDARIEMNSGYQGTNCIKVIDDTDGTPHYVGVYWDGSQGGKSIKIEKGKKYTISCYYKANDTNAKFALEAIYTDKQTNGKRLGQVTYETLNIFSPKYSEWQLFTTVISTKDAKSDYIAFNFWEFCNVNAGSIVAYISRPMVEEGDTYNGWTLSDKDYDYVGANLIDNSRTFELGGNVIRVVGTKKLVGDAYELSATLGNDYNTFYEIDNTAFKLNTDYTISFEVKGDAKYMGIYVYYKPTNTPWAYCKEQQDYPLYEENGDGKTDGYGVLLEVKDLSDKTQKVWSHFKFKERLPEFIYFQFPNNQDQSGVTSWNVTITKPKIEEGAVVTEYTERKSDLVDKASLKKAGIEVKSDEVLLYGDKIRVDNNGQTAAMFKDGKLNADLIDADTINVHHVWAKDGNNQNTLAHFGNYDIDEAKDEDGKQYPLWVGSSTAADSPFRVSKDGYMYADKGAFGVRYYEDEDSGARKKYGRFEITGDGLSSGAVFKEDSMKLTDTRFQLIKAEGRSAIFIDTDQTLAAPGPGTYLSAKMRVDAIDTTDGYHSNVCYFAEAKNGVQNYALRGTGDVSVNGGVYGYKYTMINMTTKNVFLDNTGSLRGTAYNEVQKIDSLTLIVSSKKYLALALPTLGTIKQILFGSQNFNEKFCIRLTVVMDIGSESIALRGRCTTKDGAGVAQWNTKDLPLITHWNGGYWADFDMAEGDSYEFLLTYNPYKSYTLDGFTQPYLARIINRQY